MKWPWSLIGSKEARVANVDGAVGLHRMILVPGQGPFQISSAGRPHPQCLTSQH